MELDEPPEELLNVKWDSSLEDQREFLSEDYLHHYSAAYRILNDEFTKDWSSDSGDDHRWQKPPPQPPKQKIKFNLLRRYRPFSAYPRSSSLTINQHRVYLQLMKKFSNKISPYMSQQDQEEFQAYQNLQVKVAAEQIEYLDFLRNFALSNQSRYSSISADIKRYANERWQARLRNALKYRRYYRPYRTIGLVLNDSKEPLDFLPQDEILRKGKMSILDMSRKHQKIERMYTKILKLHPIISEEIANKATLTTFNCPVSQDKNAEIIADNMNVEFVLSSSGVKRICDNYPPFNKSWEIPVIVKEFSVLENGLSVKKKVVFIDKALPRRKMTVVDKLSSYYKVAIKSYLVKYRRDLLRAESVGDERQQMSQQVEDSIKLDSCDTKDLECFGVDGPTCSRNTVGKPCNGMENRRPKEQRAVLNQGPDKINAPEENCGVSEQNDTPNKMNDSDIVKNGSNVMKNDDDADASFASVSDSDEEHLVIDDPAIVEEKNNEAKSENRQASSSKDSKKMSPKSSKIDVNDEATFEDSLKPKTRRMAKMLETLHKVEEIASTKDNNSRASASIALKRKLDLDENLESISIDGNSPNKDVNGQQNDRGASGGAKLGRRSQSLLDELLEQQKKWLERERPKSDSCSSIPVDIKEKKDFLSDYKLIPPAYGHNHVYRLFTLKKKNSSIPGYRILMRYKIDAQEASKCNKGRSVVIVPKLEFQPEFGAEIVTVSEMIQDWLSLRMRPSSFLIRARINAFTSDIMMVEQKETKDFYRDEKYHNVQASSCLHTLEATLRAFHDLPPGEYVFSHDPKMGAFANIYIATDDTSGGLYDLHEQYKVDTTADEPLVLSSLWVPIDFSIITPLQEELERVPGTFIPKSQMKYRKRSNKKKSKKKEADSAPVASG